MEREEIAKRIINQVRMDLPNSASRELILAKSIMSDIYGRRGIGAEMAMIDQSVTREIISDWKAIIEQVFDIKPAFDLEKIKVKTDLIKQKIELIKIYADLHFESDRKQIQHEILFIDNLIKELE